jgi:predicted ribosome quality control (RQC) complex YloA/Tae2 family protein
VNLETISKVADELKKVLVGHRCGKLLPLGRSSFAIDIRSGDGRFLFVDASPADPRAYLVKRRLRDLERAAVGPSPFLTILQKHLTGAEFVTVAPLPSERVLKIGLSRRTELGELAEFTLVLQLTGRSANVLLLDQAGRILDRLRETSGEGQQVGDLYAPPRRSAESGRSSSADLPADASISSSLDRYYLEKEFEKRFRDRAQGAIRKLDSAISKKRSLRKKLEKDLERHGDAEKWKRTGDLLLANTANAWREGDKIFVTDLYDEAQPTIAVEADENLSVSEAAEKYFRRYTKARNAAVEIQKRMLETDSAIASLEKQMTRLAAAIEERDDEALDEFAPRTEKPKSGQPRKKREAPFNGARTFKSSDGMEILVGKKAADNDQLTFRIARSLDLWLHAADYPGSHVVVRNPNRLEIPPQTLLEAAELAAFYSDARSQPKAAVNYTQKKFVNKPKGSAPGLVRLAFFKTILVEPKVSAALVSPG